MWSVETIMRSLWTNEGPITALTNKWGVYCQLIANNAASSRHSLSIFTTFSLHSAELCLSWLRNVPRSTDPQEIVGIRVWINIATFWILIIHHEFSCGHYYPLSTTPLLVPFWGQFSSCSCINCRCWWELWVRDNFILACGHRRYRGDRCHVNTWPGHCSGLCPPDFVGFLSATVRSSHSRRALGPLK